jgi:hypothetical protein
MTLHKNSNNLTVCQSILQPVSQNENEWKTFPWLVWSRWWFRSLYNSHIQKKKTNQPNQPLKNTVIITNQKLYSTDTSHERHVWCPTCANVRRQTHTLNSFFQSFIGVNISISVSMSCPCFIDWNVMKI